MPAPGTHEGDIGWESGLREHTQDAMTLCQLGATRFQRIHSLSLGLSDLWIREKYHHVTLVNATETADGPAKTSEFLCTHL